MMKKFLFSLALFALCANVSNAQAPASKPGSWKAYDKIQKAAQAVGQENGFTLIVPQAAAVYMSADVVDVNPLVKAKIAAPAAK